MANTHEYIAKAEVTSGTASAIDFSSIPATYTDLIIYLTAKGSGNDNGFNNYLVYLNSSSSATNRSALTVYTGGSSMATAEYTPNNASLFSFVQSTDAHFSTVNFYFPNYTSSATKFFMAETAAPINGAGQTGFTVGKWADNTAINRIYIAGTTFQTYTNAYLYGIKNS